MKGIHFPKIKEKKHIIIGAVCVITAGCLAFMGIFASSQKSIDAVAEEVETAYITRENLKKTISLTGTIAATENYSLSSDVVETTVKKVNVKVGDRVKKGDVIAVLDPTTIENSLALANSNLGVTIQKNAIDVEMAQRAYDAAMSQANMLANRKTQEENKAQLEAQKAQEELDTALEKKEKISFEQKDDNGDVNSMKNRVERLTEKSRDLEKSVNAAQNEYDNACTKRDDLKSALDTAYSKLEEAASEDGDRSVLEMEYNNAKSAYEAAQREVEIVKETLDTAKNDQTDNENDLTDANKELTEREGILSESKAKKSEMEGKYDTAKTNLETAQTNQLNASYGLEDQRLENAKTIADMKDQVAAAILAGKSDELSARQEVEKLEKQLKKCTIKAPANGIVIAVDVKEGEEYKGTQIAMISDDSGYKVSSTADQYDISDITQGMKVLIGTQTTGEDNMKGVLSFVSPIPVSAQDTASTDEGGATTTSASKSTQSGYPIEASIKNPSDRLRIGMTAKLTIVVDKAKDALALPENCIQTDEDGSEYVEVWDQESKKGTKIPITRGLETDYYVQVIGDGLEEGMCVKVPANAYLEEDYSEFEDEL